MSLLRLLTLLAIVAPATPALAWMERIGPGYFVFQGVFALAPDGAVFLDAGWKPSRHARAIAIEKRAANGTRRWQRRMLGKGTGHDGEITAMAVTASGDVVAVGRWGNPGERWLAVRLRSRDGHRVWRREIASTAFPTGHHRANAVAIAPGGRVVVAGTLDASGRYPDPPDETFAVVALDEHDGSERWRYVLQLLPPPTRNAAGAVAVDVAGDVVAGGRATVGRREHGEVDAYLIAKLDGPTGVEQWRTLLDPTFVGEALAVTPAGDVVVGGDSRIPGASNDATVALVDGDTGALRWSRRLLPGAATWTRVFAVRGLAGGDVVAAGLLPDAQGGTTGFAVVRLSGDDGTERWRRFIPSDDGEGGGGLARSLALSPDGDVVVGGETSARETCLDITVAELAPADGTVRRIRRLDGTTHATSCVRSDCERPPCDDPRAGIDVDRLWGLALRPKGDVLVAGEVCDGPRGRERGLLATLPLD